MSTHIIGDCIRQGAAAKVADETMQSKAFTVPQAEIAGKQENILIAKQLITALNSLQPLPACVPLLWTGMAVYAANFVTLCRLPRSQCSACTRYHSGKRYA